MKQYSRILIVCAFALLFTACPPVNPPVTADPDLVAVQQAKDALQIVYALGDSFSSVTQDITLSTSGSDGVNISWTSNAQAIISNTGVVSQPIVGQNDTAVVMTATLTKNSAALTKTFNLTVLARILGFTISNDWTTIASILNPSVYSVIQDGTKIYAGTMNKGLLYSDDSGTNWSLINAANNGIAYDQVYVVKTSGTKVFLGTFNGLTVWDRSTSAITNYLSGKKVSDIVIDGSTIYLATPSGIYSSAIASISSIDSSAAYVTSFSYPEYLFLSGTSLYASGASSVAKPEELNVFSTSNMSAEPVKIDVVAGTTSTVGPVYVNDQTLMVGIDFTLYRSTNGGVSFVEDLSSGGGTIKGFASTGSYLTMVKYGSSLWYSSDLGATWSDTAVPGYNGFVGINAQGVFWNGTELIIAHNKGIVTGKLE